MLNQISLALIAIIFCLPVFVLAENEGFYCSHNVNRVFCDSLDGTAIDKDGSYILTREEIRNMKLTEINMYNDIGIDSAESFPTDELILSKR
jgi:hypothetical protein